MVLWESVLYNRIPDISERKWHCNKKISFDNIGNIYPMAAMYYIVYHYLQYSLFLIFVDRILQAILVDSPKHSLVAACPTLCPSCPLKENISLLLVGGKMYNCFCCKPIPIISRSRSLYPWGNSNDANCVASLLSSSLRKRFPCQFHCLLAPACCLFERYVAFNSPQDMQVLMGQPSPHRAFKSLWGYQVRMGDSSSHKTFFS